MSAAPGEELDQTLLGGLEVAGQLGTDPQLGLSRQEAARRREADGPNELRSKPPVPLWRKMLGQFQDPLIYLLLVAIAISLAAWAVEGGTGLPLDAVVIAAIVLLNAAIGFVQEAQAESAVAALSAMTAANATVVRDGALQTIPARDVVVGDLLALSEGDSVGADARLLSATSLRLQEAALTGESEAVEKDPAPLAAPAALGDRLNMVFRGTAVVHGVGRAVVTGTGMDTEMGGVAQLLDATEEEPTPLQREVGRVSRTLGLAVIAIALVTMVVLALVNGVHGTADLVTILLLGVSLAVAAVPEGLPAILSLVLAIGVRAMARRQAVVKRLHSVETLGSASVVCSDKTGTLTRNEMTLTRVITVSGEVELTGAGTADGVAHVVGAVDAEAADRALQESRRVMVGGALANNAQLSEEDGRVRTEGDPTEAAFLVAARKFDGVRDRMAGYRREAEIPFNSERKMMSTLHSRPGPGGLRLFTKGAPDVLLQHCTAVQRGGDVLPLDEAVRARLLDDVHRLSRQAYRTLGVAWREIDDADAGRAVDEGAEEDLVYCGVVGIIDPPREEARDAVAQAHRAGVRVIMITGDHPVTATRIAADLGILKEGTGALTGAELDGLRDGEFDDAVASASVFARVAPQHKLRIVDALQAQGNVVAMTGDGVNDAPALKSADIGVAMGITGTEVTKEAARMILGDDNFATIIAAIEQGRVIFDNIRKFLRYLLSSNMGEVATVFFGVLLADFLGLTDASAPGNIVVPLLATQILWINLVTDSAPALAMGVDPAVDDVMGRPPRRLGERVIDAAMWRRIGFTGVVMGAVSLLAIDLFLPGGLVEGHHSLTEARTAGFTTLVLAQLFNALNSRSDLSSAFRRLFSNPWLWAALVFGAAAQVAVVELPGLQEAFGTAPLTTAQWLACVALASVVLWSEEVVKAVRRARRRRARPA